MQQQNIYSHYQTLKQTLETDLSFNLISTMKNIKFLTLLSLLFLIGCNEDEIKMYIGEDAINLYSLDKERTVRELQVPFGFYEESIMDTTVYVSATIQSVVRDYDRIVKVTFPDSLSEYNNKLFQITPEVILPAGETSVKIPVKVFRDGLDVFESGFNVIVKVEDSNDFKAGVYDYTTIITTNTMPTQWIGYTSWFPSTFGQCTPTKYRFVFSVFGIYDFTEAGTQSNVMIVYRNYLRTKLDEYEFEHGERLWDTDLNQYVTFP